MFAAAGRPEGFTAASVECSIKRHLMVPECTNKPISKELHTHQDSRKKNEWWGKSGRVGRRERVAGVRVAGWSKRWLQDVGK